MARKAAGDEPLPEEDPSNPVFKPLPEPSRLDSFLITNQISNYCNQINGYVGSRCYSLVFSGGGEAVLHGTFITTHDS